MSESLSAVLDADTNAFTESVKSAFLQKLSMIDTRTLEWLVMEHYQFSCANTGFLLTAVDCTAQLAESGVSAELLRNANEENGHARMYKQAMLEVGTDVEHRVEFPATTTFLSEIGGLCTPDPSLALGALYATETAAIFEHELLDAVCRHISERRGYSYEGTLIKRFHDIHLADGVEQGHKDGLAIFVDLDQTGQHLPSGQAIEGDQVRQGAGEAVAIMQVWWKALMAKALPRT